MADMVNQILAKPIQLTDQICKASEDVHSSKQECLELKSKTEKLAALLRQAARASSDLYERPTRRIIDDTEQVLEKALTLVTKCRTGGVMRRVFTIIPATAFKKMSSQLDNSIGDVSWLLRVSASADSRGGDQYLGLPPIAANEPILCLIWEQIATLSNGLLEDRSDAAASLVSLARDNDRYGKLIIEEAGVLPLLKLIKEGKPEGQENAALAIGLLGRDPESVQYMIQAGVCIVFAKILKEGPMKVQSMVAWAVSELTTNHPKSQDHFAQNHIIRLLVAHLAFETIEEHNKYAITSNKSALSSIHSVVVATKNQNHHPDNEQDQVYSRKLLDEQNSTLIPPHPDGKQNLTRMHTLVMQTMSNNLAHKPQSKPPQTQINKPVNHHSKHQRNISSSISKGREMEDPVIKSTMKAMAAKALWHLAKGNSSICKSITESRALLCFAVLLEKGNNEVQYNSAMALMEIAAVAEEDQDLRRSAFKPNSLACKAVVHQLLNAIEKGESDLLIPCIKAMGHLARTFRATETRIIGPLVRLLDEREAEVSKEAAIALTKFACKENYLHLDHSNAIVRAGGVKHLIQLVYFGEQIVQIPALVLLCHIAFNVPEDDELAEAEVLTVLEWASKQGIMSQHPSFYPILSDAKGKLELYQSRGGSRRF